MISCVCLHLLQAGEVEEVCGSVSLVVELPRVGQLKLVVHGGRVTHTCRGRQGVWLEGARVEAAAKLCNVLVGRPAHCRSGGTLRGVDGGRRQLAHWTNPLHTLLPTASSRPALIC